ncbi:MAG: peptidase domain-containing ABC transporter [Paenibacillus macerans]|nr:peptidase domain-containing ABC transporter [Paenibacillus macerans]
MEHSECGLACLAMILGYYGYNTTLPEMRKKFGEAPSGVNMHQLQMMALEYKLECKGYKITTEQLDRMKPPLILFWDNNHFVVMEKFGKYKVSILDPAKGRYGINIKELGEKFSGFVLSLTPRDLFTPKKRKKEFFFILSVLKGWKLLFSIILVALFLQALGVFIPQLTQWFIDVVIGGQHQNLLFPFSAAIGLLFLYILGFHCLRGWLIAKLQSKIDTTMMTQYIGRLFMLPYNFFENRKGGELVFRANSNILIRNVLSNRVVSIIIDCLSFITFAALMLNKMVSMGIIVIIIGIFMLGFIFLSSYISQRLSRQEVSTQTELYGFLSENIQNITDLKLLGAERDAVAKWKSIFEKQLKATEKRNVWTSILSSNSVSIQLTLPLFVLWPGAYYVLEGNATLGSLMGFQALAASFIVPIVSLGQTYSDIVNVRTYIQRLQDVIESPPEYTGEKVPSISFQGHVEFCDVSFKYNKYGNEVLKNISLNVRPGERLAIVGTSGSGKSTLAKLLLGLYEPTEGFIKIDGTMLHLWNKQELRKRISSVVQESRLFNSTIADNIRMHHNDITLDMIVQATKQAAIHDDIMKLPLGYQTMVSENGFNFSGGQRQRLLLARALLHQPKILVLDEATSSLDSASEQLICDSLSHIQCTQIIIAHRLSTVRHADRIVVLDNGKIIEEGTHQELLHLKGQYYNLYTSQEEKQSFSPIS